MDDRSVALIAGVTAASRRNFSDLVVVLNGRGLIRLTFWFIYVNIIPMSHEPSAHRPWIVKLSMSKETEVMSTEAEVICRPIVDNDIDAVIACLERGFPDRPKNYWTLALERMARRPAIEDYPRYGHALIVEGRVVGVLLQIYSRRNSPVGSGIRCNLSSWCVDKGHRSHSLMLHLRSVSCKEVTYLNISPAAHTIKTIEALGYRRYSEGQFFSAPILSALQRSVRVVAFTAHGPEAVLLSENERQLLGEHAAMGCLAIICVKDGLAYPFVFQPRSVVRNLIPCPQLIFCRDVSEFIEFANPIGRYLLFRSGPFCVVDAMNYLPGLAGWFFRGRLQKYFKGPVPPGLGDLAYTELVLLGP